MNKGKFEETEVEVVESDEELEEAAFGPTRRMNKQILAGLSLAASLVVGVGWTATLPDPDDTRPAVVAKTSNDDAINADNGNDKKERNGNDKKDKKGSHKLKGKKVQ